MKNIKKILIAGLTAGTLDAVAAIVFFAKPPNLHNSEMIFRYIASGILGNTAYEPGFIYPLAGLILHFVIATIWSAVYFMILFPVFKSGYVWAKIILFACLIWIVMNGFVLPLCGLGSVHTNPWAVMRSFLILLVCVSLPVSLIAEKKI